MTRSIIPGRGLGWARDLLFDYTKYTCGNCPQWSQRLEECSIFKTRHSPTGPGCLVLLQDFQDRGFTQTGNSGNFEKDILGPYRVATIPKARWEGLKGNSGPRIKLGLEFPLDLAKDIIPLGDFNFALAKEVIKHPELTYLYKKHGGGPTYLDNSTNEEGTPCSLDEMGRAIGIVNPSLVVAPDFLGDSKATLAALPEFEYRFGKSTALPVVQGSSFGEVLGCAQTLRAMGYTMVAVPYDIVRGVNSTLVSMSRTRSLVVGYLVEMGFIDIHLLGLTSLEELVIYREVQEVKDKIASIDTGMPISLGLRGVGYPYEPIVKSKPTLRDMEDTLGTQWDTLEVVYSNIAFLRTLL